MTKRTLLLFGLLVSLIPAIAQAPFQTVERKSPDGKFTYTQVINDPLNVRTYKLPNGLTVMLSVNKNAPRIQTLIATRAGSKNDPADNTGLAHYLEHMLFKGTDKYGSLDWTREKEQLDKIDALYEKYNKTKDPVQRKSIYHQIDSVSGVASGHAIANEYDKMLSVIGATGTNAFTSLEQTVYVNDIPQNQIENWLNIESERFRNPVLRLFHTELEAVYEEKNISLDEDDSKVFDVLMENLFTKHAYGTQSTIGTVEHLKNPSLIKIRNYYNTYYVPNNMAIIMAGDFDPDMLIGKIAEKFGYMVPKPVPEYTFQPEPVRTAPVEKTVYGPDAQSVLIGYRMPGANTREVDYLVLCDYLLANSKAGFIDLNLVKKQRVLEAYSATWINKDYSLQFLGGKSNEGQSLEEVKQLLQEQINLLRTGAFDDKMLHAIIANFKVDKIRAFESNQGRAFTMLESFIVGKPWNEQAAILDRLSSVTKADLVKFANQYYTNDYVVVYKMTGEDKNVVKVDKPEITPVNLNRDKTSPFTKAVTESQAPNIKPVFLDYQQDISTAMVGGKVPVYHVLNKDNGLFRLYYVLDMGKFHHIKLPIAVELLQFLGTDKYSAEEISKEFFNLACDYSVSAGDEQVYISVSGLDENFEKAVTLFEHLISNAKPDQQALNNLVEQKLKEREDNKLNKQMIFWTALRSYAMYGKNNPARYVLSKEELKALKAEDLVKLIHSLTTYEHAIYYYGPRSLQITTDYLTSAHKIPAKLTPYPKPVEFTRLETNTNKVYFVNYNMVQAELVWLNKQTMPFDTVSFPLISMFNEYFGGGMSSLVFQSIRESKALAYSTYSRYNVPTKKTDPFVVLAYIGTQADKMNDAVAAMNDLLSNMPVDEKSFNTAKSAQRAQIETERITKEQIIFSYMNAKRLGLHHDRRKDVYEGLEHLSVSDLKKFHDTRYRNNAYHYCVMGSKEKVKMTDLEKLGPVTELSLKEIFGY
ncbi:MAG: insulinase family protein [Bacteroidia bacterium]|jgi:predicted Zn-dependent peptidase